MEERGGGEEGGGGEGRSSTVGDGGVNNGEGEKARFEGCHREALHFERRNVRVDHHQRVV
eukprot:2090840-Rhodomonas_salina.1